MNRGLGQTERLFFAYLQMRGQQTVRTGELAGPLRFSTTTERKLLSRLFRAGMIARVWRGLYLAPRTLPLGGKWSPDEALVLNTLMEEFGGRYQICGMNAFNRYGFTDQVPIRVYAYNNRLSCERKVGIVDLTLIKVDDARLGDTEVTITANGDRAVYASRTRTLVDAVYDWARFNTLPRAYEWIRSDLVAGRIEEAELVRVTLRYGDVGTIRRMGALLDRAGIAPTALRKLERALKSSSGFIPWVPKRPNRGMRDRRWGIVWNDHA